MLIARSDMDVSRNSIGLLCAIGTVALGAATGLVQAQGLTAPSLPGETKPMVVAQDTVNLDAPPMDFATKRPDAKPGDPEDTPNVTAPPSGISLSVSGTAAAQVTTGSNGSSNRPASDAQRR